ncbi:omega-conotoxin-like protein 1 [Ptiloglossa arizonensis]|uniref:omega-conotoxin-like protein 1 n=1 Tax=Ptiloglossa arizonensis TaxID=3350558 RepID=UPI003F9FE58C
MAKLMLYIFITLLATTVIMAAPQSCGRHGDSCNSDRECCNSLKCHRYANRCQVQITAEELLMQREIILGKKGKAY